MVKIAGKRASLQALNGELLALPGVVDGAMFLPSADATRLAAVIVAPGCAKHEIRKTLAGRIDSAFMPRPLILAHSLPRDGNGKLAVGELRALLPVSVTPTAPSDADGIETLTGLAVVPRDHPALPGHFPGHPIVPGVVLLELMEALLAHNGYGVLGCPQVKFLVPVAPQTPLTLRAVISHRTSARFAIDVAGKSAVVGRFDCVPSLVDT